MPTFDAIVCPAPVGKYLLVHIPQDDREEWLAALPTLNLSDIVLFKIVSHAVRLLR